MRKTSYLVIYSNGRHHLFESWNIELAYCEAVLYSYDKVINASILSITADGITKYFDFELTFSTKNL